MIEINTVPVKIGLMHFNPKLKHDEIDEYIQENRLNDLTEDD